MYWTFVGSAVRLRMRRLFLAFSALAVAAALATALFTIYSDVERRLREEFRAYGANLIVASKSIRPAVPLDAVAEARRSGAAALPVLFASGKLAGQPVALAGVDFEELTDLTRFWRVEGSRSGCLAGADLAQRFALHAGSTVALEGAPCQLGGIVSTGGAEDGELILPFAVVSQLSGVVGQASIVQVRAPGVRLESMRASLQKSFPSTDVRIVQAVAETETSVVRKVQSALFLLLALVLVITTLSVSSNFSELVMERSREIGILKAIGAAEPRIATLFLTESLLLSLAAALTGYLTGAVLAGWIGRSVFAVPFSVHLQLPVLLLASALTLLIAFAATALAAGAVWRIEPARILRGE